MLTIGQQRMDIGMVVGPHHIQGLGGDSRSFRRALQLGTSTEICVAWHPWIGHIHGCNTYPWKKVPFHGRIALISWISYFL